LFDRRQTDAGFFMIMGKNMRNLTKQELEFVSGGKITINVTGTGGAGGKGGVLSNLASGGAGGGATGGSAVATFSIGGSASVSFGGGDGGSGIVVEVI
jgi:hypothetical protein